MHGDALVLVLGFKSFHLTWAFPIQTECLGFKSFHLTWASPIQTEFSIRTTK